MIGKIVKGSAFKGCVQYVMGKNQAKLLASEGVLTESPASIINSFYTQYLMNPDIKRPVGHISLSYSKHDASILTDNKMVDLAKEYMQQMNITDTQYIIVRHEDRVHPHVHIVFNRINNNSKTISDKNDRYRNEKVCKELKLKHGLYFAEGKDEVKIDRLRDRDKAKYEIYHAVKESLETTKSWADLQKNLKSKGIDVKYKYKGQTDVIQGVSFIKDNLTFKGSEVDRSFSFINLDKQIGQNNKISAQEPVSQPRTQNTNNRTSSFTDLIPNEVCGLPANNFDQTAQEQAEYNRLKKKKKKRGFRL